MFLRASSLQCYARNPACGSEQYDVELEEKFRSLKSIGLSFIGNANRFRCHTIVQCIVRTPDKCFYRGVAIFANILCCKYKLILCISFWTPFRLVWHCFNTFVQFYLPQQKTSLFTSKITTPASPTLLREVNRHLCRLDQACVSK